MLGLKIESKYAEKIKKYLLENNLLSSFQPIKEKNYVIFPLKKRKKFSFPHSFVYRSFEPYEKALSLKEALKQVLTKKELNSLITSYDTVGDIAVLQIPKELEKKEKIIAETLLKTNKNLKTVCKIISPHKGLFRIQKIKPIAGKKTTLCTYKESGAVMKFDLNKTFFSPRLSTERLRIAKQIKKGEVVGVFFAGVGPFALVFAKNSQMKKAIAIELNPHACKAMKENIKLNKITNIEALCGDVREKAKGLVFDRIVMPSPHTADSFLDIAKECSKPDTIIHYYIFAPSNNPFEKALKDITSFFPNSKILRKAKVRSFSPKTIQIVVDFQAGK